MMALAGICIAMGLFSFPIMDALCTGISGITSVDVGYRKALSGNMEPLTLGILLAGCILLMFLATRVFRNVHARSDTWACGGTLDERMQYSSEGFSQPIVRVFHPIYGDTSEKRGHRYITRFLEPFVKYIYRPVGSFIIRLSEQAKRLQTGNIQSYLGYILVTLVVALLAVRLL
jgi:hydrogenase-4 component B